MPKISVIVPVYNVEEYLNRCVDSILNQTFSDFELILVDDGSVDKSGIICDEYVKKDKRVRVIHKKNGGVSAARNIGIDEAQGEYISFCDSDDYLENTFFQRAMEICKEYHVDLYKAPYTMIRDAEKEKIGAFSFPKLYKNSLDIPEGDFVFPLVQAYISNCWASLIRKTIIGDTRFDVNCTFGEDTKFVFDLLAKGISLFADNQFLYNYYHIPGSLTGKISVNKCENIKEHYLFFFDYTKRFSPNGKQWYEYVESLCANDIYGSIKRIIKGEYSFFQRRKMLDILLSEQVFINSCIKYYDEYQNSKGTMTTTYILNKEYKRKLKHRLRRIKHRIIK